jgi:hypothetical protein
VKHIKIRLSFLAGAAFLLLAGTASAQDCDRACFEQLVDDYLDAVIDNDPDAVPLSDDVRFTENGQLLLIGDGLWNTMKSRGNYRIFTTDVRAQQVAFLGNIAEDHRDPTQETPALLSLRLRLEDGEITEIEHFVVRNEDTAARFANISPDPIFTQTIPEDQRDSRETLLVQANKYFSGMEQNDGMGDYPFHPECDRFENGGRSTNVPTPPGQVRPDPSDSSSYSAQWSCLEQFESGLIFFVNRIRDRRYVAVDEERGLVFAFGFFDHSGGEWRNGVTPDGREVIAGPVQPWTWEIAELFRIENGLIRKIEAFLERSPYGMNSGWSTWEQGMSSELQDVTFSED